VLEPSRGWGKSCRAGPFHSLRVLAAFLDSRGPESGMGVATTQSFQSTCIYSPVRVATFRCSKLAPKSPDDPPAESGDSALELSVAPEGAAVEFVPASIVRSYVTGDWQAAGLTWTVAPGSGQGCGLNLVQAQSKSTHPDIAFALESLSLRAGGG
jgi:hypothetical protein